MLGSSAQAQPLWEERGPVPAAVSSQHVPKLSLGLFWLSLATRDLRAADPWSVASELRSVLLLDIYVSMCKPVWSHICPCTHTYTHVIQTCGHEHVCQNTGVQHVHMYSYPCVHTHNSVLVYVCTGEYICLCICMHVHARVAPVYMHVHVCPHACVCMQKQPTWLVQCPTFFLRGGSSRQC